MKSSRQWAQDIFRSVRGRLPAATESDRWVVGQLAHFIARIKREAFAAGAHRYRSRLLTQADPAEKQRIRQVPLELPPAE